MAETNGPETVEHNGDLHQNAGKSLPNCIVVKQAECQAVDTEVQLGMSGNGNEGTASLIGTVNQENGHVAGIELDSENNEVCQTRLHIY